MDLEQTTYLFAALIIAMIGWTLGLYHNQDSLREDFVKKTMESLKDPAVMNITRECSSLPRDEIQVECVQKIMNTINYKQHEGLLTPMELLEKGGLCRDIVSAQAAVFNNLGWDYTFTFPLNKHVFITIWTPITEGDGFGLYCNLDWGSYACYRLTG